jgi:tetratricopeptide (TPR) repeat protein
MMNIIQSKRITRLRQKGQKLLMKAQYHKAHRCFEKALALDASPENQFHVALSLLSLQRFAEAEKLFGSVKEQVPDNEINLVSLAEALMMQRRWDEAASCYRELTAKEKPNPAYTRMLNIAEDVALREKYVRGRELMTQAQEALRRKNDEEARQILEQALEYQPHNAAILNNLGSVLRLQKKYDEAAGYIQRALEIEPRNEKFQKNLILARKKIKKIGS